MKPRDMPPIFALMCKLTRHICYNSPRLQRVGVVKSLVYFSKGAPMGCIAFTHQKFISNSNLSKHPWSWLFGYDIFMTFQRHDFINGNISCSNVTLHIMITSSNGNIFRVTCPLCGNSPVTGEFTSQRPMTRSFVVFLISAWTNGSVNNRDPRWFETPLHSLWRHCNDAGKVLEPILWNQYQFHTTRNFFFFIVKHLHALQYNTLFSFTLFSCL